MKMGVTIAEKAIATTKTTVTMISIPCNRISECGERGSVVVILPLLILLVAMAIYMVNMPLLITSADVVLKNSVSLAVKGAVNQFEETGNGSAINIEKAHSKFGHILAANLKLGQDLQPTQFSAFKDLDYMLMIYNGESAELYEYHEGRLTQSSVERPNLFYITSETPIILSAPGAIAIVSATPKIISTKGSDETQCSRWAVAVLKKTNDGYKAHLCGTERVA